MPRDFSQEQDLWQSIINNTDAASQSLAHLLLQQANTVTPAAIDSEDLTDLFLEYQNVAIQCRDFLQNALPHLEESYRGQDFETQLQNLRIELDALIVQAQQSQQQLAELRQLETQLREQQQNSNALQVDVQQLQTNLQQLQTQTAELPSSFDDLIANAEQQHEQAAIRLLQSLPPIVELISQNQQTYQTHFETNQRLVEALRRDAQFHNISSQAERLQRVQQTLQQQLQAFDGLLLEMVESAEKQRSVLRELREPQTSIALPEEELED